MKKVCTLVFLLRSDEICLALKKRGFGINYLNGYGGKVETGETVTEGALRELLEESKVVAQESDLEKVVTNLFIFKDGLEMEVHTFFIRTWKREPEETEEMKPAWFPLTEIPYEKMWADDPHWLPRALVGEKIKGKVWFKEDGKTIERMEWENTESF